MHAYEVVNGIGEARHFVPNKSKGGTRPTTIRDLKANNWLPSPTEILKTLAKPQLVNWLIRQSVYAVTTAVDIEGESLDAKIERILDTEKQQDQESRAAMDLGSRIHEAIEDALSDRPWDASLEEYVHAVRCELVKLGEVHATEKILVGDGYAGKTDCLMRGVGKLTVVDFKTCRNIPKEPYDEALLQISAYCGAVGNIGEDRIEAVIMYVSTSSPGEVKVCPVESWRGHLERFKLLLEFYQRTNDLEWHGK